MIAVLLAAVVAAVASAAPDLSTGLAGRVERLADLPAGTAHVEAIVLDGGLLWAVADARTVRLARGADARGPVVAEARVPGRILAVDLFEVGGRPRLAVVHRVGSSIATTIYAVEDGALEAVETLAHRAARPIGPAGGLVVQERGTDGAWRPAEVHVLGANRAADGSWVAVTAEGDLVRSRGGARVARVEGDFNRLGGPSADANRRWRLGTEDAALRAPPAVVGGYAAVAENPAARGLLAGALAPPAAASRIRLFDLDGGGLEEAGALGPLDGPVLDLEADPARPGRLLWLRDAGGRVALETIDVAFAPTSASAASPAEAGPSGEAGTTRLRRAWPTMGTLAEVEVEVPAGRSAEAERAIEEARAAFERVDRAMSVYRPASDLVRANHAAGGRAVEVDPWLADCVAKGIAFAAASGGAFSVNTLAYGIAVGLKPASGMPAFETPPAGGLSPGGDARIEVGVAPPSLRLPAGTGLDLGGIAKGYALDRAAEALRARGIERFFVTLGRSVIAGAAPEGEEGWPVVVEGETEPIPIANLSIAVSRQRADADTPHVVDPRTGEPAAVGAGEDGRWVAVAATTGWVADAASTALLVDPSAEADLRAAYAEIRWVRTGRLGDLR